LERCLAILAARHHQPSFESSIRMLSINFGEAAPTNFDHDRCPDPRRWSRIHRSPWTRLRSGVEPGRWSASSSVETMAPRQAWQRSGQSPACRGSAAPGNAKKPVACFQELEKQLDLPEKTDHRSLKRPHGRRVARTEGRWVTSTGPAAGRRCSWLTGPFVSLPPLRVAFAFESGGDSLRTQWAGQEERPK